MEQKFTRIIHSPIGFLKLVANYDELLALEFTLSKVENSPIQPLILDETEIQLYEYFSGKRKEFQIKINPEGTVFQKHIWEFVSKIKFGETVSYLTIAKISGNGKNTRAVGMANGKNSIPIIIPCHRIIGSDGKLTGYAGGLQKKQWLLQHELKFTNNKDHLLF
jgi:methylated-DNA-[protein]-cysteine S-methyltransferase